ncbi:MAG TPA: stage II sporulation protein P [Syntrophomonas sp.]|nr:stage II sporulation protein P [Syntrophomonas sp.]HRW11713.1 stage II sporulation protein P [Syntrophomonas sp.]
MHKKLFALASVMLLFLLITAGLVVAQQELPSNRYFSLIDEDNHVIHQTGTQVYPGDVYIAANNSKFKVVEVSGYTARCVYQGQETLPSLDTARLQSLLEGGILPAVSKAANNKIAVYHTHSDESYVPSDGKESINGNGGIYDVGEAFVKQLQAQGFKVVYNKNNHNPHDINAYNRSRKTASTLLKEMPAAIIDVHRDATPPGEYQANVKGQDVTKIKLVVGRSNPNSQTNLQFAKQLKAAMDKVSPGLSEGIFIGKGDYNQDLSPRAMLIEVGAHTNSKEEAEKGVKLFAQSLPVVLGMNGSDKTASANPEGPAQKPAGQSDQGSTTTLLILIAVVAIVIGGYFFLNRSSSKG